MPAVTPFYAFFLISGDLTEIGRAPSRDCGVIHLGGIEQSLAMQIFVRSCSISGSEASTAYLGSDSTVSDLKRNIFPDKFPLDAVYISFGGRILRDGHRLSVFGIGDCSTVSWGWKLRGGGGDGGATGAESRDCYLKIYQDRKPDKVDPSEARLARWTRCALSAEALKPPCVIDLLGNIIKEAIVNSMVTKSLPKKLGYIKGLKDLITVHFSSIPGIEPDDEHTETKFQCPITGQEFNGNVKFFVLKGCGHVLSTKALKAIQSSSCLVCYASFLEEDMIIANPTEDEVAILQKHMEDGKAKVREKKEKRVKNGQIVPVVEATLEDDKVMQLKHAQLRKPAKGEELKIAPLNKRKEANVMLDAKGNLKKFRAMDKMPENATKEVYASIFSSSS